MQGHSPLPSGVKNPTNKKCGGCPKASRSMKLAGVTWGSYSVVPSAGPLLRRNASRGQVRQENFPGVGRTGWRAAVFQCRRLDVPLGKAWKGGMKRLPGRSEPTRRRKGYRPGRLNSTGIDPGAPLYRRCRSSLYGVALSWLRRYLVVRRA